MPKYLAGFSGFSVKDLDEAKKFYGDILGLDCRSDEMGMLEINLPGGGKVMIYPKDDHLPATYTMLNLVVGDIGSAVKDLADKGVKFEHYSNGFIKTDEHGIAKSPGGEGPTMAWCKDPAGNIIGLLQE